MNLKNTEVLKKVSLEGGVELSLLKDSGTGKRIIHRFAPRGKVNNYIENYEFISSNNESSLLPLDDEKATQIIERVEKGGPYSSAFIFYEDDSEQEDIVREKSLEEHTFTSTGIKFWRHQDQMFSYKSGGGESVISTHISPEGACNLKCPYCSVTYRDTHSRIELDVIKDYVIKLQSRGLKAVILTGGGEPTSYKYFNELVQWIKYERNLSIALITNGTLVRRLEEKTLKAFSWIRISVNLFDQWESRIGNNFDASFLSPDCTVGCSMVYTVEHESTEEMLTDRVGLLKKVSKIADRVNAQYIRLLPNCLLEQKHLIAQHKALDKTLQKVEDSRFFHQYKVHGAPSSHICHQAYFRPYLSEEPYKKTGAPGEILDFLDKKISQKFDPRERCKGCVFTENVNMLDDWVNNRADDFQSHPTPIRHEEFV